MAILRTSRVFSSICSDGELESEFGDDTDAEQLATAHCTSAQQSGGGSAPTTAKADPSSGYGLPGEETPQSGGKH